MADAQLFYLPGGASISVKGDGSVVYSYYEEGMPYSTDDDISKTNLGALLRETLLEIPLRDQTQPDSFIEGSLNAIRSKVLGLRVKGLRVEGNDKPNGVIEDTHVPCGIVGMIW